NTFGRESGPESARYWRVICSNSPCNRAAHERVAVRALSSEPTLVSPDSWLRISIFCPYGRSASADVSWCGIDGPKTDWWFATGIELYLRLLDYRLCIVDLCFGYLRNVCWPPSIRSGASGSSRLRRCRRRERDRSECHFDSHSAGRPFARTDERAELDGTQSIPGADRDSPYHRQHRNYPVQHP